jgi:hypothetical protein
MPTSTTTSRLRHIAKRAVRQATGRRWHRYESAKRYVQRTCDLEPREYERAITFICDELSL